MLTLEKRIAIIALHKWSSHPKEICKLLKKLLVTERFMFRSLARYRETDDVEDRPQEKRPRCVRWLNVVHAVPKQIHRNPLHHQKGPTAEIGISRV